MALRCNNCGAPLSVPPGDEQAYAVCTYCQTATALPRRRRSQQKNQKRPTNQVEVTSATRSASPVKLFLAVAAVSLLGAAAVAAYQVFREHRPLPGALAAAGTPDSPSDAQLRKTEDSVGVETTKTRESSSAARERTGPEATATSRKSLRSADAGAASPTSKPTTTSAPTPAPTPSPSPTPTPPAPPPLPKNVKAVIGNIKIETGKYSMDTLKSRMASNTGAARACYEQTLLEKPDTEGTLNMGFQIAPAGTTRGVGVTGSFLPSNLSSCMNRAFLALKFPPTEGESVNVRFTVKLSHD
jgi:hypothetical protein